MSHTQNEGSYVPHDADTMMGEQGWILEQRLDKYNGEIFLLADSLNQQDGNDKGAESFMKGGHQMKDELWESTKSKESPISKRRR